MLLISKDSFQPENNHPLWDEWKKKKWSYKDLIVQTFHEKSINCWVIN